VKRKDADLDFTEIHYRCVCPDHVTAVASGSGLTIHDGRWAYCPSGSVRAEHRWEPAGPLRVWELRKAAVQDDDSLLAALSAAEELYAELRSAIGATSVRLEIARPSAPLSIDLGNGSIEGPARLELELADASGIVGRVVIGDVRENGFDDRQSAAAYRIAARYAKTLRRWLSARATK
jgi:hypothetical protein